MSKVVNIAAIRSNKERREDSSRWGNQALVMPATGDDRNEKCLSTNCHNFADYDVQGSAERHGLTCGYHLDDYIHRFFAAEYAGKPHPRHTYCESGINPDWKDWQRAKWRLEYRRGVDDKQSRIDFPTRPTKRQIKKAEHSAYARALKGEEA